MSPLYHGVTVADAVLMVKAWGGDITAGAIRQWVKRGKVHRTKDGQIDPFTLEEFWRFERDHKRAARVAA